MIAIFFLFKLFDWNIAIKSLGHPAFISSHLRMLRSIRKITRQKNVTIHIWCKILIFQNPYTINLKIGYFLMWIGILNHKNLKYWIGHIELFFWWVLTSHLQFKNFSWTLSTKIHIQWFFVHSQDKNKHTEHNVNTGEHLVFSG